MVTEATVLADANYVNLYYYCFQPVGGSMTWRCTIDKDTPASFISADKTTSQAALDDAWDKYNA